MSAHAREAVVVVGAGPAGLAVAWHLARHGIPFRLVDGAARVAEPWRARHDHLQLNTHRALSSLPGLRIPRAAGAYPHRDAYVAYLERYEHLLRRRAGVEIGWGRKVHAVRPEADGRWRLETSKGPLAARHVVLATGPEREPFVPDWPGRDDFKGELLHAGAFRRAEAYRGRRVLVVGGGTSGVDLAGVLDRAGVAALWMSVRRGATVLPRRLLGVPLQPLSLLARRTSVASQDRSARWLSRLAFGDLTRLGYPAAPCGPYARMLADGTGPAIDDGFVAALRAGRLVCVPEIEAFEGERVRLADGATLRPDAVLCATGYRTGLARLLGPVAEGVLDAHERPLAVAAPLEAAPGLWFSGACSSFHGNLWARGPEARRLVRALARAV
jgi:cation diffusion facilitator CzcD-associated flavoprotein CzcO